MNLIDDPSIYPVVTTDLMGSLLKVRTYGLDKYGFFDFVLEDNFENYHAIFCSLIESVLRLSFDYEKEWFLNGRLFHTDIQENTLAYIKDIEVTSQIKTLTIYHPSRNEPLRYQSLGLQKLYQHRELHVQASIADAFGLLAYAISEVQKGFIYDEDCIVTYGENSFGFIRVVGRSGHDILKIERV
ncbi:hypothetical protein N6H14_14660 [Paenibacillus sp. CC-CFT747]|nr:hypothetical protein N6H14_14660 [Paenibacillus sp. CC-CFT747]